MSAHSAGNCESIRTAGGHFYIVIFFVSPFVMCVHQLFFQEEPFSHFRFSCRSCLHVRINICIQSKKALIMFGFNFEGKQQ